MVNRDACLFVFVQLIGLYSRLDAHLPVLEQQFSKPTNEGLTQDGNSDFFNFSTGRRNVASLHTIFALRPRHDLFQWAFQVLRTFVDLQYRPKDDLQLDFKLLPVNIFSTTRCLIFTYAI